MKVIANNNPVAVAPCFTEVCAGVNGWLNRLIYNCALLLSVLALSGFLHGQTPVLQVTTDGGATVRSGETLYIDTSPFMPDVNLEVANTCGTLFWDLVISWTGVGGQATYVSTNGQIPCGQWDSLDWVTIGYYGGTATIQWYVTAPNGTTPGSGTFTFTIAGTNPPPSSVDALASVPWFFENIIQWESKYRQFDSSGNPLNCNCPNGIGLTQLDPPFTNNDFWDWVNNVEDGLLMVLTPKQALAYASWSNELAQMIATTGSSPVYPRTTSYSYCSFAYPQSNNDSYADGDWIHAYNGGYYIFWDPPANGVAGFWDIDTNGYVASVCNSKAQ